MLDGGTAVVRVIADASKLSATIAASTRGATSGFAGLGQRISSALSNPLVLAGGVVAGVTAKMGYDFEDAFTRIDAISNASTKDIAQWREQITELGAQTASSPKELAEALYFLASAGLKTSAVFPALAASAKASAVGLGSVAQVGSVVAAVLNAYAGSGLNATDVTDTLVSAVRESRAETDEFGQTLGRLLPISARAGISFGELAGSLASLSNIGLDVYEASTAMRAAIQAITAPGEKAANTMNEIGLSSQDLLDAIHKRGLLGALKLLDSAIKDNTSSESEYLRKFRDIVPNVRALTGVLGLTGANLKHVQSIFEATTNATGDAAEAFSTTAEGPAFKFRQAIVKLTIIGTELGSKILPGITDILNLLAPILGVAADNAKKLLLAFLAYKAVTFLPVLLGGIAAGLTALSGGAAVAAAANVSNFGSATVTAYAAAQAAKSGGSGLVGWLTGVSGAAVKAKAGIFGVAYALGDQAAYAQTTKTELRDLNAAAQTYYNGLQKGTLTEKDLQGFIEGNVTALHGNAEAFQLATTHGMSYSDALFQIGATGMEGAQHQRQINQSVRQSVKHFSDSGRAANKTAQAYIRWGFASAEAFGKYQEELGKTLQTAPGDFKKLGDAFSITPKEAEKQLSLALQITRTKIRDLKRIFADKDLTKGQKLALAGLAPEYRHAWAEAGDEGKRAIERLSSRLARANGTSIPKIMDPLKKLKPKSQEAGRSIPAGITAGIYAGTSQAVGAAQQLVNRVNGVLQRGWKFGSPSKVTQQFGAWFVEGLIIGLQSREKALENAADHVSNVLLNALEKSRDKYKGILDKLKSDLQEKMGDAFTKKAYLEAVSNNVAAAAAQAAIALARSRVQQAHELEKMVKQAEKQLNRLIEKFKDFKDSIKSGFDDFKDLGGVISSAWAQYLSDVEAYQQALKDFQANPSEGATAPVAPVAPNISNIITETVANAQRLAKDLMDAAKAGLSKELLAQFAGQGAAGADALEQLLANPALIAQLNAAAEVINDAANGTASALGNQFFGKAIKEATQEFNHAVVALKAFIKAMIKVLIELGLNAEQLKHIREQLNANAGGGAGNGAGGGGGGNGNGGSGGGSGTGTGGTYGTGVPDHSPSGTSPPIFRPFMVGAASRGDVNVNGPVTIVAQNPEEFMDKLTERFQKRANNNGGKTGMEGKRS